MFVEGEDGKDLITVDLQLAPPVSEREDEKGCFIFARRVSITCLCVLITLIEE